MGSRQTKRHQSENVVDRKNSHQSSGVNNFPYYGTSSKFMQMNGKPRQLPQLGEQSSQKVERVSNNRKEKMTSATPMLAKHEKTKKALSSMFRSHKDKAIEDHEDKLKANLFGQKIRIEINQHQVDEDDMNVEVAESK
jgi:hypothetical protein